LVEGGCFVKTKLYCTYNAIAFIELTFCGKFDIVPSVVIITPLNLQLLVPVCEWFFLL